MPLDPTAKPTPRNYGEFQLKRIADAMERIAAAQRQHGLTMAEVTAMALRAHAADLGDCGDDELCHDPYAALRTED